MLPCLALVILNILLFRAMREADRKREKLLKTRCVSAATNHSGNSATVTNTVKPLGGESKETKKIRDTNNTTSMLVVVITVIRYNSLISTSNFNPVYVIDRNHLFLNSLDDSK